MPRLPGPEDLGGIPNPRSGRPIASYDSSAVGEGMARFGADVARTGNVLSIGDEQERRRKRAEQEKDEAFRVQTDFLKFEQAQRDRYTAEAENVQPGAVGFSDTFTKSYAEEGKKWFSNVPERLRAEYDLRLTDLEGRLKDATGKFETEERNRNAGVQIAAGQEIVLNRLNEDPNAWSSADQDAEAQIKASPLTPVQQDEEIRKWRQRRAAALFQIDNGRDANGARERLGIDATVDVSDAATALRHFEGYSSDAYWDVNAYRAGYGSDTVTLADGSVVPVTKDTIVTREDAERDLARRAQEFAGTASKQVGATAWDRLDSKARSALTSVAYNYGSLPESVVQAVRTGDEEAIATAVERLPANPARRRQEADIIRGGEVGPAPQYADLSYEDRRKLYEASLKGQRTEIADQVEDYVAFLRAGNPDTGQFSLPELQRAFDPDQAAVVRSEIDKAAAYGADVAAVQWASPEELTGIIEERSELLKQPEEFRENAQNLNGLASVIKERNTALVNDPATYVQQDPQIAASYEAMTGEDAPPNAVSAYASTALAKQTELGLPPEAQRILPAQAVQSIVSQFKSQPEGGQNAAQLMASLETQWGKYWPQVFGELSKDLPGTALVIGAMNRPGQEAAAQKLASLALIGREELAKAFPPTDVTDLKDAVRGEMEDFGMTLSSNPPGPAAQAYATFEESINLLALGYMREGKDYSAAAAQAYEDVLGKGYTMMGTYRVPIEYDADAISQNADYILSNFSGENVALPTSLTGLSEEETRAGYMSALKANGFWVTSPDESGLTLYDGTGRPVLTTEGAPARMTWQQILEMGEGAPPTPTATGDLPYGIGP